MAKYKKKKKSHYFIKKHPFQQTVTAYLKFSHNVNKYHTVDIERTRAAMRNLTGSAFKMYMYLCQINNGDKLLLSCSKFVAATGLSEPAYQLTKKELQEKGYLILLPNNDFEFYNEPQSEEFIRKKQEVPEKKPKKPPTKEQMTIARLMGKDLSDNNN